jgi:hypothetical protein
MRTFQWGVHFRLDDRCGEVFVTGGSGREGFAVLGTFSSARSAQTAVSAA